MYVTAHFPFPGLLNLTLIFVDTTVLTRPPHANVVIYFLDGSDYRLSVRLKAVCRLKVLMNHAIACALRYLAELKFGAPSTKTSGLSEGAPVFDRPDAAKH